MAAGAHYAINRTWIEWEVEAEQYRRVLVIETWLNLADPGNTSDLEDAVTAGARRESGSVDKIRVVQGVEPDRD